MALPSNFVVSRLVQTKFGVYLQNLTSSFQNYRKITKNDVTAEL